MFSPESAAAMVADPLLRDLEQRQARLEQRSLELAEHLRALRAKQGENHPELKAVREELVRVLNEQFEVRTELRHRELEQIQREIQRLHQAVERLRTDLEQRTKERAAIIERRVNQLAGEGLDW